MILMAARRVQGHMGYSVTQKPEWITSLLKDLNGVVNGKK